MCVWFELFRLHLAPRFFPIIRDSKEGREVFANFSGFCALLNLCSLVSCCFRFSELAWIFYEGANYFPRRASKHQRHKSQQTNDNDFHSIYRTNDNTENAVRAEWLIMSNYLSLITKRGDMFAFGLAVHVRHIWLQSSLSSCKYLSFS